MPASHLSVGLCWGCCPAHLGAGGCGSLPLGSPPASSTLDIPLTHLAPHGSDSAAPPGVRFPASVPAKEGVCVCGGHLALHSSPSPTPGLLFQGQFHSSDFFGLLQTHIAKGYGEESSDRNLGGQRETESRKNPECKLPAREI